MTLKTYFSLSLMSYALLVLLLFATAYYTAEKRAALQSQIVEQKKAVDKIASVCRAMSLSSNAFVAINYINDIKKDPALVFAACLNPRGLVQVHSDRQWFGRTLNNPSDLEVLRADVPGHRIRKNSKGTLVLEWYVPVFVDANKTGVAYAGYNQDTLEEEVQRRLWATLKQLLGVSAAISSLALFLGTALAWSLSRPIRKLVEAVHAIGAGNWDYQIPAAQRTDELRFLAHELQVMARRIKELDELKDQLISEVSHDLRNPMGAIKMYAEFMLDQDAEKDKISPRQREMLGVIMDNARRLNLFVSSILDAAKIRAGRMQYHLEPVALDPIVRNIMALYHIVAAQQDIALVSEMPRDIPAVNADPERLEQILANLVANALRFAQPGGRVGIRAKRLEKAVEIQVSNTAGISKDQVSQLFHHFAQADSAQQRVKGTGTGLGLFIVKETVEAMGGKVWMESEAGEGTQVYIHLPFKEKPRA